MHISINWKVFRKNRLKIIIFIFLYTLIQSFIDVNGIIPQGFAPIFNLVFLSLLMSFLTQTSLIPSFITMAIVYILFFTIELVVIFVYMLIFNVDLETTTNTFPARLFCGIIMKVVELLVTVLIRKSNVKIRKLMEFKKPNTLFQLMILQTFMIATILFSLSYITSYKSNIAIYNIYIIAIYLLFLVLNIIDFKERERLQAIQTRFKVQDEYINNMENILNIIEGKNMIFQII